ncbi:MAG: hypothetical protein JXB88_18575 [Spirochaetales bacterium]|nr:hypothetical protein [Spirochaetales bacterium]
MNYLPDSYERKYLRWFVIYIMPGTEYKMKKIIENTIQKPVTTIVFSKEIIKKNKGKKIKIIHPLFPGYIFVHQHCRLVLDTLKGILAHSVFKPVCFKQNKCENQFMDNSPCMISPEEMKLLLDNSDQYGVLHLSYGYKKDDKVIITDGPLRNLQAEILYINEKKNFVGVNIQLFNKEMRINLGIDIVTKIPVE